MAALTALAIGAMAAGAYESYSGSQKQGEGYDTMQQGAMIQQQAAQQQAQISKNQAASSVVFAGQDRDINNLASQQSIDAANQSNTLNKGNIAQQQALMLQQKQAMETDARRSSLENIRNQQRARSMALATNVSQGGSGALNGGNSAVGGAYGQIGGQTGVNQLGVSQALAGGEANYAANYAISNNNIALGDLQTLYSNQQAQNQTAKSNLSYQYAQTNAAYQSQYADTQTLASQGAGLVSQGQGMVGQGTSQMQLGGQLFSAGPSIFSMGTNFTQMQGSWSSIFAPSQQVVNPLFGGGSPSGYGR